VTKYVSISKVNKRNSNIIIITKSLGVVRPSLVATGGMTLAHEVPARSIVIFLPPITRCYLLPPTQT